jgi:hypothetical protein
VGEMRDAIEGMLGEGGERADALERAMEKNISLNEAWAEIMEERGGPVTMGMCANYHERCPNFEKPVVAREGDCCGFCQQRLLHESGLTWADARREGYASAGAA